MSEDRVQRKVQKAKPAGKRSRGRPPISWMETIIKMEGKEQKKEK